MNNPPEGIDTVEGVLVALDQILERALEQGDRVGYFAAIYRKVTAKVAEGIATGFFDDPVRMNRLDVTFATRFFVALADYEQGSKPSRSWEVAFAASSAARPLIVQHLLLGISAHINLDLGIAAADTATGGDLPGLRRDFDRVNEILAVLSIGIERDLVSVSPWIGLLSRIGGRHDEEIVRFSIEVARTQAWHFANELAPLPPDHWSGPISARDARVARLGHRILHPGWLTIGLSIIRARESNDVRRNIEALMGVPEPSLAEVEARVRALR